MSVQSTGSTNTVDPTLLATMNGTKTATDTTQEAQDRFLKLLVTQMQNQDPLNPMDNAQVTSQLAQLSTVTGIDKLNTSVVSLGASLQSTQILQASSMINHGVLAEGTSMILAKTSSEADAPQRRDLRRGAASGCQLPSA